jgi:hypothetical protein
MRVGERVGEREYVHVRIESERKRLRERTGVTAATPNTLHRKLRHGTPKLPKQESTCMWEIESERESLRERTGVTAATSNTLLRKYGMGHLSYLSKQMQTNVRCMECCLLSRSLFQYRLLRCTMP